MEPLVSVIVPIYNVCSYLREALDSLVSQTYNHLEILLIDDGSTDGSGAVCDEYAARFPDRIRVIRQNNQGLSGARNTGLDHMRGELVAFLDPDDAFHPDTIRRMVRALYRRRADIVVCGYGIYPTRKIMRASRRNSVHTVSGERLLSRSEALGCMIDGTISHAVWNRLYRRKCWETIRFPQGQVYEDVNTSCRVLSEADRILLIPEVLVKYRKRPGSITQTHSLRNTLDYFAAVRQYEAFVRDHVPEYYRAEQLETLRKNQLRGMILQWTRIPAGRQKEAARLRGEILAAGNRVSLSPKHLRTWTAFQMIRFCPWLIPVIMPVYRPLRELFRKVTGR